MVGSLGSVVVARGRAVACSSGSRAGSVELMVGFQALAQDRFEALLAARAGGSGRGGGQLQTVFAAWSLPEARGMPSKHA